MGVNHPIFARMPDQIAAASRRERRRERADDRRRVRHRIARKQQLAQRVVLQPFAQHVLIERAIDRDHAADTEQLKPKPSWIGRKSSAVMNTMIE